MSKDKNKKYNMKINNSLNECKFAVVSPKRLPRRLKKKCKKKKICITEAHYIPPNSIENINIKINVNKLQYCDHCGIEIKDKSKAWHRSRKHYCNKSCLEDDR